MSQQFIYSLFCLALAGYHCSDEKVLKKTCCDPGLRLKGFRAVCARCRVRAAGPSSQRQQSVFPSPTLAMILTPNLFFFRCPTALYTRHHDRSHPTLPVLWARYKYQYDDLDTAKLQVDGRVAKVSLEGTSYLVNPPNLIPQLITTPVRTPHQTFGLVPNLPGQTPSHSSALVPLGPCTARTSTTIWRRMRDWDVQKYTVHSTGVIRQPMYSKHRGETPLRNSHFS